MAAEANLPNLIAGNIGEAAAFAAGLAVAPLLEPYLQELRNVTWSGTPSRPIDPHDAARAVAEGLITQPVGADEAAFSGLAKTPFSRLVGISYAAPGTGELLQMLRRNTIGENDFTHGLRKARYETIYDAGLRELANVKLSPQQIALAVVRSLMQDPGFLPVSLDVSGGTVPAYGTSTLDTIAEASYAGVDRERLRIMVGEIGLPMPPDAAANAVFRGIIKRADFNRAVLEGDTRPEWASAIFDFARQIPSVANFVQLYLRDWTDAAGMYTGAARHGMRAEDVDVLYKISGRPPTARQMIVGYRRGARVAGLTDSEDAYVAKAVRQSDIRPEYIELEHAANLSYPSAFVVRQITQAGGFTESEASDILYESGWPRKYANKAAAAFATPASATATDYITKANTQLWSTAHRSYIASESDDAAARLALQTLGVPADQLDGVLVLWQAERELIRKQLTPTQIRKAVKALVTNPATGSPWTREEAIDAIVARGYSLADAETFMDLA